MSAGMDAPLWPFERISAKEWADLAQWQRWVVEDAACHKLKELLVEAALKREGVRKRPAGWRVIEGQLPGGAR